jgi:quercetin dioxygenase-like cupin family protein
VSKSYIRNVDSVPFHGVEWGQTKVVFGLAPSPGGELSDMLDIKVTEYLPRYSHYRHRHPGQVEVIYVLSGRGEHEHADGTRTPIGPGDMVYVPENQFHGNHNPHDEPLRAMILKIPPCATANDVRG